MSFGPGFEWLDKILGNEPEADEDELNGSDPDEESPDDADAE